MRTLLVEEPDDALLDRWEVEHLPTWLRFVPDAESGSEHGDGSDAHGLPGADSDPATSSSAERPSGGSALREGELRGRPPGGEEIILPGPWKLTDRRSGALPKHVVDAELGPGAR